MKKQTRILFLLAIVSLATGWVALHRQNAGLESRLAAAKEARP